MACYGDFHLKLLLPNHALPARLQVSNCIHRNRRILARGV